MTYAPHIPIVDDDGVHRNFFALLVTQVVSAAQITLVKTGYDALTTYRQHGADLLIVDHWLPDVQGYTLLLYLRETGVTMPIILVSGYLPAHGMLHDEHTVVLQKPVRVPEFVAAVTRFLPRANAPG